MTLGELRKIVNALDLPDDTEIYTEGEYDSITGNAYYETVNYFGLAEVPFYKTKNGFAVPFVCCSSLPEDGVTKLLVINQLEPSPPISKRSELSEEEKMAFMKMLEKENIER